MEKNNIKKATKKSNKVDPKILETLANIKLKKEEDELKKLKE